MNLGKLLKAEVQRVAKREINAAVKPLRDLTKRQRNEIADLKRTIRELGTKARSDRAKAKRAVITSEDKQRRFSPTRLGILREKKGLSLVELAKLVDISGPTLTRWLAGESRPKPEQLQRIAWIRAQGKRELRRELDGLKG
ncbi:hypothetical protein C7S18_09765 [Ahniella affigens]|uniref:HTH cro/C1-type domain-containing protein n=1 Tax=Ahniella affigens TaxID=2021234 RepID=A0A2P1PRL4_9GAMM|nr:helix-turn-helix transcriptional regulator [Ahniella affigens]AVP97465.1 hypothetical protein C7S18_09765 [Ahniella affigens]